MNKFDHILSGTRPPICRFGDAKMFVYPVTNYNEIGLEVREDSAVHFLDPAAACRISD